MLHVRNLGAGVQSTTLYLLGLDGELDHAFDVAIFADTGEEPKDVYRHLEWLQSLGGPPIMICGVGGRMGDHLVNGVNSTGNRFASIPAFTNDAAGNVGMIRRQCTSEYKIGPVEKTIRYQLLGLKPRQRAPKNAVTQYMGFSMDEPGRAARARMRFAERGWTDVAFPLIDPLVMTRNDCVRYLEGRVPHSVPKSACVFCPYKSNRAWRLMKRHDPDGWARAVEVDEAIREVANANDDGRLFVHRSCKPLAEANLDESQLELFDLDCEGGCGL